MHSTYILIWYISCFSIVVVDVCSRCVFFTASVCGVCLSLSSAALSSLLPSSSTSSSYSACATLPHFLSDCQFITMAYVRECVCVCLSSDFAPSLLH